MKRRTKKGRHSLKNKKHAKDNWDEVEVPRSFIIHRGNVSASILNLMNDFKMVMNPNTSGKLLAKKRNALKDFITMSGSFGVSHLIIFSQTDAGINLKIGRLPQGPTLQFNVQSYSLMKDVLNQKDQSIEGKKWNYAPCLMLNIQPNEGAQHHQLCSKMFLDMFPTINPTSVNIKTIQRCCLIHYDKATDLFDFRHYVIKSRPVGISKATRKIIGNKIPNLSDFKEVSDFVTKSEVLSDSEFEDDPSNHITLDKSKKGKPRKEQAIIKLVEIGPRLTLKLIKIESDLCSGSLLHHSFIKKTAEEILEIEKKKEEQRKLKQKRKKEQAKNVALKKAEKEAHNKKCLKGMGLDSSSKKRPLFENEEQEDDKNDEDYYREEVGEEPDEDLFKHKEKRKPVHVKKYRKKKDDSE